MDLRSLWRRLGGPGSDPGSDAATGSHPEAPQGLAAGPGIERPTRPSWRDLPPIVRTIERPPVIARTVDFSHELSGHQPPPLALEVLGHEVRADAPVGVVSGLATHHRAAASPVADTSRPLRMSVRSASNAEPEASFGASPLRLAGSTATGSPSAAGGATPSSGLVASPTPTPTVVPAHRPVVARSPAMREGPSAPAALVRATQPEGSKPAGTIGRAQPAGTPRPVSAAPAPDAAAGRTADARASDSPPVASSPGEVDQPVGQPPAARMNLGQTRRLRIGPPLDALGLEPHPAIRPAGAIPEPGLQAGSALGPEVAALTVKGSTAADAMSGPATGLPDPTVSRKPADAPHDPGSSDRAHGASPTSTSASAEPVPARPIAAGRPIETVPLVGRLAVGRASRPAPGPSASASAPPFSPRRPQPTPEPSRGRPTTAAIVAALASGSGGIVGTARDPDWTEVGVPSSGSSNAGVLARDLEAGPGSGAAAPPAPGELVVARSIASLGGSSAQSGTASISSPATWQPPIRRLRATPASHGGITPGGTTSAADPSTRSVGGIRTVQTSHADGPASGWSAAPSRTSDAPHAASVETAPSGTIVIGPPLQRAADDGARDLALPAASTTWPTVSRQDDGSPPAGGADDGAGASGAAAGGSDKELDELARKLFPRMQLRLRNELLIDRERIGTLVDLGR